MTTRTVTTLIRLQPGEALHLPLDSRTTLQIAAGSVVLREPLRWLADTIVAPAVRLSEGQSHRLAQAGWVELRAADGGAEVCSHRPMSAWQVLWPALRRRLSLPGRAARKGPLQGDAQIARPTTAIANTATPIARFITTM